MPTARVDVNLHGASTVFAAPGRVVSNVSIPTVVPTITNASRFAGDPGPGLVIHGMNDATTSSHPNAFNDVEVATGHTFKLRRTYNGANWGVNTSACNADITAGRIPFTSWKINPYTLTTVPDSAIDTISTYFLSKAPAPIWATFFHEPENDYTTSTDAAAYRTLFRRMVLRIRSAGVTNVAWCSPTFMGPFTFQASSGRDWRWWHPDWTGGTTNTAADFYSGTGVNASVIDIDSFDHYVPNIGTSTYQTLTDALSIIKTKMASNGYTPKPWAIGEEGMRDGNTTVSPTFIPNIMQDALECAVANNFVGISWWNTGGDSFLHGPVPASDPNGYREAKLAQIVADSRSR